MLYGVLLSNWDYKEVLSFLFKGEIPNQGGNQISEAHSQKREKLNLSKTDVQNTTQQAINSSRQQQQQQSVETIVRDQPKIGRNERVTIKNVLSGETKEVKFKQAIPLIEKNEWVIYKN